MSLFKNIPEGPQKFDGNFEKPQLTSQYIEETIDGAKVYSASFVIHNAFYEKTAKDTPLENAYPPAYLVEESNLTEIGGGVVEYTLSWAELPETHYDYTTIVVEFPGFLTGFSEIQSAGREIVTKTVPAIIQYDYFLTENPDEDIELEEAQGYWGAGGVGFPVDNKKLGNISTPTKDTYLGWILDKTLIVVEDSKFTNWRGNIWRRETVKTRAQ